MNNRFAWLLIMTSLSGVLEKGHYMMEQFVERCLSDVDEKSFHSTMTKSGIITFGDTQRNEKHHGVGKGVSLNIIISPESVLDVISLYLGFEMMLLQRRSVSHPVGQDPASLFHENGTMKKHQNSDVGEVLEAVPQKAQSCHHLTKASLST